MMIDHKRTDSGNTDFHYFIQELDKELAIRDGDDYAFYSQYNKTIDIKYVIVAYENSIAVGCGAIRPHPTDTIEVKRMYVPPHKRGEGIAAGILKALEQWALELNYHRCILETGRKQPEAIALYTKSGYHIIPNYGQYQQVDNSVCFEKILH